MAFVNCHLVQGVARGISVKRLVKFARTVKYFFVKIAFKTGVLHILFRIICHARNKVYAVFRRFFGY